MKTKVFKSKRSYSDVRIDSDVWVMDNDDIVIIANQIYFYDRIDETHTVIIAYHK